MTSKLTRERIELIANFHRAMALPPSHAEIEELARMALAAMDSEPVAVIDLANLDYLLSGADADVWPPEREEMGDVLLYRHAQPAPVAQKEPISFDEWSRKCALQITLCYPDFREKAKYIWDSARETQQPAPVVPEEATPDSIEILASARRRDHAVFQWDEDQRNAAADSWNACRAAILAAATQLPGSDPATVPGKWISVSERMPEKNQNVLISVNFDSDLVEPLICSARYTGSTFRRGDATVKPGAGIEEATHWMPLPAAPQEVKP